MSESMTVTAEPSEAVIISGPHKGEIVTLTNGTIDISDELWGMLDEALDGLLAAVDRLDARIEAFIEKVSREPAEAV